MSRGLAPGLRASVRIVVSKADTAIAVGSGDVPVLATPRLLALAEAAAVAAVAPQLGAGLTSVGTGMSLEHRRACPVGAEVVVDADLTEVDGRRLVFSFIARQERAQPASLPAQSSSQPGQPASQPPRPAGDQEPDAGEDLVVGAGTVERVVVDRAKFLARLGGPVGRMRREWAAERTGGADGSDAGGGAGVGDGRVGDHVDEVRNPGAEGPA